MDTPSNVPSISIIKQEINWANISADRRGAAALECLYGDDPFIHRCRTRFSSSFSLSFTWNFMEKRSCTKRHRKRVVSIRHETEASPSRLLTSLKNSPSGAAAAAAELNQKVLRKSPLWCLLIAPIIIFCAKRANCRCVGREVLRTLDNKFNGFFLGFFNFRSRHAPTRTRKFCTSTPDLHI